MKERQKPIRIIALRVYTCASVFVNCCCSLLMIHDKCLLSAQCELAISIWKGLLGILNSNSAIRSIEICLVDCVSIFDLELRIKSVENSHLSGNSSSSSSITILCWWLHKCLRIAVTFMCSLGAHLVLTLCCQRWRQLAFNIRLLFNFSPLFVNSNHKSLE